VVVPPGEDIDADRWLWVAVASVGSAVGVTLLVTALRDGKVGVVMPIVSTQGALAGLVAVAAGASLSPATAFLMLLMTAAVAVVSRGPATATGGRPEHARRAIALAIVAALILAVALYAA